MVAFSRNNSSKGNVVSGDARPVNLFCRRLVEAGLVEDVTVQRLDV
jgi:hypothetical protein